MFTKIIEILSIFIIGSISMMGYFGVGLMMAIESMCIPLPSEIIMPFAGYLVHTGQFTMLGITLAGAIGSVFGSWLAYWAGIYGGRTFIQKYGKYFLITNHDLELADRFFAKYGNSAVFFSRMMPVVRTFISLPAGIAKMDFKKFTVYSFLGSIPWSWFLGYLGLKMGANWDTLGVYFHKADLVIGMLIVAGLIWFVRRFIKIQKESARSM